MSNTSKREKLLGIFHGNNPRYHYKQVDEIEGCAIYESTQLTPENISAESGLIKLAFTGLFMGVVGLGFVAGPSFSVFYPLSPANQLHWAMFIPWLLGGLVFMGLSWASVKQTFRTNQSLGLLDKEVQATLLRLGIDRSYSDNGGVYYRPTAWYQYTVEGTTYELCVRGPIGYTGSFGGAVHKFEKNPMSEVRTIYYGSENPGEIAATSNKTGKPVFSSICLALALFINAQFGALINLITW